MKSNNKDITTIFFSTNDTKAKKEEIKKYDENHGISLSINDEKNTLTPKELLKIAKATKK
jgi:hypothetical protein